MLELGEARVSQFELVGDDQGAELVEIADVGQFRFRGMWNAHVCDAAEAIDAECVTSQLGAEGFLPLGTQWPFRHCQS